MKLTIPIDVDALPATPGAYLLELVLDEAVAVQAGALGRVWLPACVLVYAGSARGPGGLRARIRRHLRPTGRRDHWHVDALTRVVPVRQVTIRSNGDECALITDLLAAGWWAPVPGFGSSDCRRCPSHLLAGPSSPPRQAAAMLRGGDDARAGTAQRIGAAEGNQ